MIEFWQGKGGEQLMYYNYNYEQFTPHLEAINSSHKELDNVSNLP